MGTFGGKQIGAGRPKGMKNRATLLKEEGIKRVEQRYLRVIERLATAQISLATGSQYLYRLKKGEKRPELVTNQSEIEAYLEGRIGQDNEEIKLGDVYYFITAKDPENAAIESAYNRSVGKPVERSESTVHNTFSLLDYARRAELIEKDGKLVEIEKSKGQN